MQTARRLTGQDRVPVSVLQDARATQQAGTHHSQLTASSERFHLAAGSASSAPGPQDT